MKIVGYTEVESHLPWWVGEVGPCLTCGALIELEDSDATCDMFMWSCSETGGEWVSFICPNDHARIQIYQPPDGARHNAT